MTIESKQYDNKYIWKSNIKFIINNNILKMSYLICITKLEDVITF